MARNLPNQKNGTQNSGSEESVEDMISSAVAEVQAEVEANTSQSDSAGDFASDDENLSDVEDAIKLSLGEDIEEAAKSTPEGQAVKGEPSTTRSEPANDDRASVGGMMHSLQRQPTKTPYWTALLMSSVWLICGLTYGWVMFRDEMTGLSSFRDYLATPSLLTLTAVIVVPILFFFVIAVLTRRAQGLRLAALSMTEIAARLAEPEGVAKDAVASVGQAVRREVAAMGDGVERALARAGELEALVHGEVSALERAYGDNEIRIKGLVEELVSEREAIQTSSEAIREQLVGSHEGFNADIDKVTERITMAIEEAGSRLTETLELRSAQITSAISSTGDSVSETLLARGTNLVESLAGKANEIATAMDDSRASMNESFEARKDELSENLSQAGTAIAEMMGTRNAEIGATLTARTTEIGQFFVDQSTTAIQAMEDHSSVVQSSIQSKVAESLDTINVAGNEVGSNLITSIDNAGAMLIQHNNTIGENLNAHSEDLSTRLDAQAERVNQVLGQRTSEMGNTLARAGELLLQHNENIGESLASHASDLSEKLDTQAGRINDVLGQRSTEISYTLAQAGGDLLSSLNQQGADISANLTQSLGSINETLATKGTEVADRFATQAQQLEESMARQVETVGTTLSGRASEMNEQLLSRIGELNQVVDSGGTQLVDSLTEKTTALDATLVSHANALGTRVTAINEAGNAVARAIEHKGSEATRHLAEQGAVISQDISAKTGEIADHLTSTGADLTQKMVEHGEQVVEAMMTTDKGVATNFTEIVAKLTTSNSELHNILETAGDHLSAIEQGLGERAQTFKATIESATTETANTSARIETQVAALQDVSGIVLQDISQLSLRFEDQGKALYAAASAVSESNDRMDEALRERHESLANLTTTLSRKAEEVDNMMNNFSGMVEASLGSAESRAHEIGTLLSDRAAQSSQVIRDEFDRMNHAANEENDSAMAAVRNQHLVMRDEIVQIIADTRAGFDDMSLQIRTAVGQISQDLESTRSELHRSTVELPRDTEEQANAMRRMVSDQIRALDELSTIVTRHGGGLDTTIAESQPAYTPAPPPAPRQPARNTSSRLEAARRVVASLPEETGAPSDRNANWSMQELLARASERDQDSRYADNNYGDGTDNASPLHAVESLNSISVDLARVLDHEAPADLWNRYKAGERNVFTRRLYNLRGQRTFDDIRRKYSAEPEFHDVVDRYVNEFEGMIENVGKNDRDNILTQTYMTSDTGKVYLMLAHASGRFD